MLAELFSDTEHCAAMGRGNILIIPMKRSKISAPYLMLPEAEDIFFIGILRRHLDPCPFETLIKLNEQTYKRVVELGGYIYPVGFGAFLNDSNYWKRHYGESFDAILRGKETYDPQFRLTPNIKLFPSMFQKKNTEVQQSFKLWEQEKSVIGEQVSTELDSPQQQFIGVNKEF